MKAILINNKPKNGGRWALLESLTEGKIYEVVEVKFNGGYILKETYPQQYEERQGFDPNRFIPLSSIDETTFERNYNKQLV